MEFRPEDINSINNNEKQVDKDQLIYNLENKVSDLSEKLKQIDELKLDTEQKSKFEKIKDRIFNITRKTFNTVKWISIIGGTIGIANHERTHSDLEILTNPDGTHVYKHEDERTTHYLNILAGRDTFTEEDMRLELNGLMQYAADEKGVSLDKKISEMSIDELDDLAIKMFSNNSEDGLKKGDFKKDFYNSLNSINKLDTSDYKQNEDTYELVWQLEQECGNPKIRFVSEDLGSMRTSNYEGAKHEDIINNAIYVDPRDMKPGLSTSNGFIAEMSHMKHFNDNPVGTTLQTLSDFLGVIKRGKFNTKALSEEYHKLYSTPGSFEHTTHSIIEPYLLRKYRFFSPKEKK